MKEIAHNYSISWLTLTIISIYTIYAHFVCSELANCLRIGNFVDLQSGTIFDDADRYLGLLRPDECPGSREKFSLKTTLHIKTDTIILSITYVYQFARLLRNWVDSCHTSRDYVTLFPLSVHSAWLFSSPKYNLVLVFKILKTWYKCMKFDLNFEYKYFPNKCIFVINALSFSSVSIMYLSIISISFCIIYSRLQYLKLRHFYDIY